MLAKTNKLSDNSKHFHKKMTGTVLSNSLPWLEWSQIDNARLPISLGKVWNPIEEHFLSPLIFVRAQCFNVFCWSLKLGDRAEIWTWALCDEIRDFLWSDLMFYLSLLFSNKLVLYSRHWRFVEKEFITNTPNEHSIKDSSGSAARCRCSKRWSKSGGDTSCHARS